MNNDELYTNIKYSKLSSLLFIFLCFILFIFLFPFIKLWDYDYTILLEFLIIGLISLIFLVKSIYTHSFSLSTMFWVYIFFFLCIAASNQVANNVYFWGLIPTKDDIHITNFIIIIFILIFGICYNLPFKNKEHKSFNIKPGKIKLFFFWLIPIIYMLLVIIKIPNISYFFSRDKFSKLFSSLPLSIGSILTFVPITLLYTLCIYYIKKYKKEKNKKDLYCVIISIIISLIIAPPLAIPRFLMAAYYGTIFVAIFTCFQKYNLIPFILSFGLLFIFPLLSFFRYATDIDKLLSIIVNFDIKANFYRGDFDSYSMIIYSVRYFRLNPDALLYGQGVISSFLFFIPRSIWPTKSISLGSMIINYFHPGEFDNVSSPIIAETLVNFGYIGLVIIPFLLGVLFKKIDRIFWETHNVNNFISTSYLIFVFFLMFLLRGSLLSTFTYFIPFIVFNFIFYNFNIKKVNKYE